MSRARAPVPRIRELLADPKRKRLVLQIKPLLAGGSGLRFSRGVTVTALDADLDRIRKPNSEEMQRWQTGPRSLAEFSKNVAAGSVRFNVFADAPGCSAVVLSIWDATERIPLDHLVRWVAIARPNEPPPPCAPHAVFANRVDPDRGPGGRQMQGGLQTLLAVSLDLELSGALRLADAAFQIFETTAGTFVVFVDGRPGRKRVYAWEATESPIRHVTDPNRLPLLIKEARDLAARGKQGSYAKAAKELAAVVFSPANDEARSAQQAFKELVAELATRPVVVARVVSDLVGGRNRSLYLRSAFSVRGRRRPTAPEQCCKNR